MNGSKVIQLGRMRYAEALDVQRVHLAEVLANREAGKVGKAGNGVGRILLVEHEPVITLSRRAQSSGNLRASEDQLRAAGVEVALTDRGGDITYHGPGQLVVYPILDLNALNLRLIDYIRLLESIIIETLTSFDINAHTEPGATGVWVGEKVVQTTEQRSEKVAQRRPPPSPVADGGGAESSRRRGSSSDDVSEERETQKGTGPPLPQCLVPGAQCLPHGETRSGEMGAKIAAIGVRVQRWVSMHGFALNVDPNLAHFDLIVPCGLAGRAVTSMKEVLGDGAAVCPSMAEVSARVVEVIEARIGR